MYWQNTKTLRYFFALISIIVVASIVNFAGLNGVDQASAQTALSTTQIQTCFDTWNGKTIDFLNGDALTKSLFNNCKTPSACSIASEFIPSKVTCINPQAAVSAAASQAVVAPLITAVCGVAPPITNQTRVYVACSHKVVADYNACAMTGGPVTSSVVDTPTNIAKCFVAKGNKISVINAAKAIATGRAAGDAIITKAADAKRDADCTASGKVIVDGKCVAKPVDAPKTSCTIDGIGWIICPVMNFMGKVVDGSYGVVDGLLKTPFMNTNTADPANGTYQAWAIMRNIANVAFVIAFLIIIFSQMTSVGITNYGVKKMLPRLIIAAILVNVSYFICAIAVDISNILGSSMKQVFDNIGQDLQIKSNQASFPNAFTTGTGWQGIVGFMLAGAVGASIALYAGLSILLPALIAAVLAIVTVFLVLTMRQALLIILIVISPLAFVAYLLPNTEEWFKKWRKLFQSLLLMYPVIAVLFGGSALASQVITASDKNSFAVQVMGALVAILPLFLTVTIMKGASSMLGKVGGFVSSNGMVNKAKKGAEGYRTNRQEYRKLKSMNGERSLPGTGWAAKRRTSREAVLSNRKSELNRANAAFVADRVQTDEGFKAQLAAGGGNGADMRALAGAISVKVELSAKEVKAASAVIEDMNLDSKQLGELAAGGVGKSADGRTLNGADDAVRKAAIMGAVSIGTVGDVEEIIKSSGTMSQEQRKILSSSIASSGITNKATHLAGQTLDDIAQGKVTSEDDLNFVTARAIEGGKYSSDKIGDNDHASLKRVVDVLGQARSDISTESRDSVGVQTTLAMTDNRKGRLTKAQMPYLDVLKR